MIKKAADLAAIAVMAVAMVLVTWLIGISDDDDSDDWQGIT